MPDNSQDIFRPNEQITSALGHLQTSLEDFKSLPAIRVNVESKGPEVTSDSSGVPKTNLKETLGRMWGKIKGVLVARYPQALQVLLNKMKATLLDVATGAMEEKVASDLCAGKMNSIEGLGAKLNAFSGGISDKMAKMMNAIDKMLSVIVKLARIVNIILKLPLPQAVPPGVGVPMGVTTTMSDISKRVTGIVSIVQAIAGAIRAILAAMQAILTPAQNLLDSFNEIVALAGAYCEVKNGLDEDSEDYLDQLELLEGIEDGLETALGLLQSGLDGNGMDGWDDNLEDMVDDFNSLEREDLIPEGIKTRLRKRRLQGDIGLGDNSDVGTGDGSDQQLGPDGSLLGGVDQGNLLMNYPNSELFTAIDGNVYLLMTRDDPRSPLVAQRRFGTAQLWNEGDPSAVVLKSPLTFATDVRIILDDIKVRLNTQLAIL